MRVMQDEKKRYSCEYLLFRLGSALGNRTLDSAVRGRRLNLLTNAPYSCRFSSGKCHYKGLAPVCQSLIFIKSQGHSLAIVLVESDVDSSVIAVSNFSKDGLPEEVLVSYLLSAE